MLPGCHLPHRGLSPGCLPYGRVRGGHPRKRSAIPSRAAGANGELGAVTSRGGAHTHTPPHKNHPPLSRCGGGGGSSCLQEGLGSTSPEKDEGGEGKKLRALHASGRGGQKGCPTFQAHA